jgi:hypothetical protein
MGTKKNLANAQLLILVAVLWCAPTKATFGSEAPLSAKRWSELWRQQYEVNGADSKFIRKIVFVDKFVPKDIPVFASLNPSNFASFGYFQTIDDQDVSWSYLLNQANLPSMNGETNSPDSVAEMRDLFKVADVDTIILTSEKPNWQFIRIHNGQPNTVLKVAPPTNTKSEASIAQWLSQNMGFDAVVLAKNGRFVLATAPKKMLQLNLQALAVNDSEERITMVGVEKEGKALLELVDIYEEYGVFKVATFGKEKSNIEYGTKLILQKN